MPGIIVSPLIYGPHRQIADNGHNVLIEALGNCIYLRRFTFQGNFDLGAKSAASVHDSMPGELSFVRCWRLMILTFVRL